MLLNLSPLSISFYLTLGETIDCGIGIDKPMDSKQLYQFLSFSSEQKSILLWCGSLIPTGFYISALHNTRSLQFYIFDGHKAQNFLKGISLFEFFGSPLEKNLKDEIMKCKGEAVTAVINMSKTNILSMGLRVHNTNNSMNVLNILDIKPEFNRLTENFNYESMVLGLSSSGYRLHFTSIVTNFSTL